MLILFGVFHFLSSFFVFRVIIRFWHISGSYKTIFIFFGKKICMTNPSENSNLCLELCQCQSTRLTFLIPKKQTRFPLVTSFISGSEMRLAQMGCGRGFDKRTQNTRKPKWSLKLCMWDPHCFKILGPKFGLMLLTLKMQFMTMCEWMCHLWIDMYPWECVLQCVAFHVKDASTSFAKWLKAWACTMRLNEDYDRFDRKHYKPIKIMNVTRILRIFSGFCARLQMRECLQIVWSQKI